MIDREELYNMGRFQKPHGTRGELTLAFTDDSFCRRDNAYLVCFMDGIPVPFFIEGLRFRSDTRALVKLEGVDTAEQARRFANAEVYFPKKYASPSTEFDELTWDQLEGYLLVDVHAGPIGHILAVDDSTLNVFFAVEHNGGELLVPAHNDLVEDIDEDARVITMRLPDGLLQLAEPAASEPLNPATQPAP